MLEKTIHLNKFIICLKKQTIVTVNVIVKAAVWEAALVKTVIVEVNSNLL